MTNHMVHANKIANKIADIQRAGSQFAAPMRYSKRLDFVGIRIAQVRLSAPKLRFTGAVNFPFLKRSRFICAENLI
jgi:hypothetical protein